MTQIVADAGAHAAPRPARTQVEPLLLVRRIGYAVLALEFVGFLLWSWMLYRRFSLTSDFSFYNQGWYLIAHGNLDPQSTTQYFKVWQNHAEFLLWLMAPLYWLWPHADMLLWVQDLCVAGSQIVIFTWICEIAQRRHPGKNGAILAATGLVFLAVNPWIWWSVSFDFHMEPVALLFATLMAWDISNDRRRAWFWVVPLLASTIVSATYLMGIGIGTLLIGRRYWRRGMVMVGLGVVALLFVQAIHGNLGSISSAYDYIANGNSRKVLSLPDLVKGVLTHPLAIVKALWSKRVDVMANLAPAGLVGLADLATMPIVVVVMLTNMLFTSLLFAEPIFQSIPVYIFLPVGSVAVLARLLSRRRRTALLLCGALAAQTIGWAMVWGPDTSANWLRVSPAAAATLSSVESRIPESDEVIASQGLAGPFAARSVIHPLSKQAQVRIIGHEVWFILAPLQGIESLSTGRTMALIAKLATTPHATLVAHANGVWAFRWYPPAGTQFLVLPVELAPIPAWPEPATPGSPGRRVLSGPIQTWHMTSSGRKGYVADGMAWQAHPGKYRARVFLSATGPVNVEIWNDNGDVLLSRRSISATSGIQAIAMPVNATTEYSASAFTGWGPFRAHFIAPPPGQRLEVRVWSAGIGTVNVYSAELIAEAHHASAGKPGR